MWEFASRYPRQSFAHFEIAAAKGHEESIWIVRVVQDVEMEDMTDLDMEKNAVKESFAKTKEPLGWYFAGMLSEWDSRERFDCFKKSAEGGCSWGQVWYGEYFRLGYFYVGKDEQLYLEWMKKGANQNNPWAIDCLGKWFRTIGADEKKAMSYY
jgi:TPR repeat protein